MGSPCCRCCSTLLWTRPSVAMELRPVRPPPPQSSGSTFRFFSFSLLPPIYIPLKSFCILFSPSSPFIVVLVGNIFSWGEKVEGPTTFEIWPTGRDRPPKTMRRAHQVWKYGLTDGTSLLSRAGHHWIRQQAAYSFPEFPL